MSPVPVRLQTSVWNPMGRRRALLLHGLGSDSASWWRLASELADDGYMVLAPDLRSHGRSPTASDHSLSALAEDVVLLGEAYDLVVGHSLGGSVAALLLERPCFASAVVLVDPVLLLRDVDREPFRLAQRADVGPLDAAEIRRREPRWGARDVELKAMAAAMVSPSVVDAVLDHNDPWDLTTSTARWSSVRVHLLAADPELGAMLHPETFEALHDGERITGDIVRGAGHSIHRERPDVVVKAVRDLAPT